MLRILNEILILIIYSDFPTDQTLYKFYDLDTERDLNRLREVSFPWSIRNGCDMPVGNAYPSGHLVPSPFWDLHMLLLLRPVSPNLP